MYREGCKKTPVKCEDTRMLAVMSYFLLLGSRARQVIQRVDSHQVTAGLDTERRRGVAPLDILEDVVVERDVVLDQLADDVLPVDAGVLGASDGLARLGAGNGPSRLGDPDGLALGSSLGLVQGVEEELAAAADVVAQSAFKVRVCVHADEVESIDDSAVGAVDVDSPGVDVADGLALERGSTDSIPCLLDVLDQLLGLSTGARLVLDAGGSDAVQVLTTDRDTDHKVRKGSAVLGNGSLERCNLVVEAGLAGRAPHAEQQGCLGVDGCLDGLDDAVLSAVLNHGVQTSTGPSVGARELLGCVELIFKVYETLGLVVVELGTVVETLDGSIGRGQEGRGGQNGRGKAHIVLY
jgi:hypothetical protein